jgi:hypothetical protein
MANNIVGNPLLVVIDGNTFYPSAESEVTHGAPDIRKEYLRSTGRTFFRYTMRETPVVITVKVDTDELAVLKSLARKKTSVSMSFTLAGDERYSATGRVDYDTRSGTTADVEITMVPDYYCVEL